MRWRENVCPYSEKILEFSAGNWCTWELFFLGIVSEISSEALKLGHLYGGGYGVWVWLFWLPLGGDSARLLLEGALKFPT